MVSLRKFKLDFELFNEGRIFPLKALCFLKNAAFTTYTQSIENFRNPILVRADDELKVGMNGLKGDEKTP